MNHLMEYISFVFSLTITIILLVMGMIVVFFSFVICLYIIGFFIIASLKLTKKIFQHVKNITKKHKNK